METPVVPAASNWLRWVARAAGLGSLLMLASFLVGEGFALTHLTRREASLFLCFPFGVMLGLVWAWWRPRAGALLALGCLAGFYALYFATTGRLPHGPWFLIFTSPALLFLLAAGSCPGRSNRADPNQSRPNSS